MEERILTKHPEGKLGVNIEKKKYLLVREEILLALKEGPLTLEELSKKLQLRLKPDFEGSITWYTVTVKLDLEARGEIVRVKGAKPHQVKLR